MKLPKRVKAKKLILKAVEEEWSACEIQPLIYVRVLEKLKDKPKSDVLKISEAIGQSERLHSCLVRGGLITMLDLMELNEREVRRRCSIPNRSGLGETSMRDLAWSIQNFDKHPVASRELLKGMMPNIDVPYHRQRVSLQEREVGFHLEMV